VDCFWEIHQPPAGFFDGLRFKGTVKSRLPLSISVTDAALKPIIGATAGMVVFFLLRFFCCFLIF